MAKNRNKKKKNGVSSMDITEHTIPDLPQPMDTSQQTPSVPDSNRCTKKGVQMKRRKNVRKMRALAKAISKNEMSAEKLLKVESKTSKRNSAKKLYE